MVVVTRLVSMGTRASLPPEVFVVVDGVKSPVSVRFPAATGTLDVRFCLSQRLDKVNLAVHVHKAPVVEDERWSSPTDKGARLCLHRPTGDTHHLPPSLALTKTQCQTIAIAAKLDGATW